MDLKTLEDYQKVARAWIEDVIPSKATPFEKVICISELSIDLLRDLLWLTRKEPLPSDFDSCYLACPTSLWRPVLNKYHPDDLWLYTLLRAVEISLRKHPIFNDVSPDHQPSYEFNPKFYDIWPKMPVTTTAYSGAGFSAAEAVVNSLWKFLLNTVDIFSDRGIDMPDVAIVSMNVMGFTNEQINMEIWPNQNPAMKLWRDATLKEAKEYFPSMKWTLADLDAEYSRVSNLLIHEIRQAKEKQLLDSSAKSEEKQVDANNTTDIEQHGSNTSAHRALKSRFKIEESRILFDDTDLDLSVGKAIEVAKMLIEKFGTVVKYNLLDSESLPKEASDNLRKQKSTINEKLKNTPCTIKTKRQEGYILTTK